MKNVQIIREERDRACGYLNVAEAGEKHWGVSVAATNYRLHKLRIVSDWQNRSLNIEMSSLGLRRPEPDGVPPETSALWLKVFTSLRRERIVRQQIAVQVNLPVAELHTMLFRLTGQNAGNGDTSVGLRSV